MGDDIDRSVTGARGTAVGWRFPSRFRVCIGGQYLDACTYVAGPILDT